jgi:hypothetical protein
MTAPFPRDDAFEKKVLASRAVPHMRKNLDANACRDLHLVPTALKPLDYPPSPRTAHGSRHIQAERGRRFPRRWDFFLRARRLRLMPTLAAPSSIDGRSHACMLPLPGAIFARALRALA